MLSTALLVIFKQIILVLNYRNRELRVRLNLGLEWGKNLVGKNKTFKGYKPNRRYFQVIDFESDF